MDFGDFVQDDPNESYYSWLSKGALTFELVGVLARTLQIKSYEMRLYLIDQISTLVSDAPPLDREDFQYIPIGRESITEADGEIYFKMDQGARDLTVKLYDQVMEMTKDGLYLAKPFDRPDDDPGLAGLFPDS